MQVRLTVQHSALKCTYAGFCVLHSRVKNAMGERPSSRRTVYAVEGRVQLIHEREDHLCCGGGLHWIHEQTLLLVSQVRNQEYCQHALHEIT